MILAVDLGNYNIKTSEGKIFESCYTKIDSQADFDTELLEFNGKFYKMEQGDFDNEFNKAEKDYLPNLLYAISKSVESPAEIDLVLGVPASNLGISDKIKEKLQNQKFNFKVFGVEKEVKINRVATVAEGLSSFYTLPKEERNKDIAILDIGGRTINVCTFTRNKNTNKFTVGGGMLDFYSDIRESHNNKVGKGYDVENIIRLIKADKINCSADKINFVKKQLNKIKIDLPDIETYKIYVTGGGSLDLQEALTVNLGSINYIPNALFSNVEGNKIIATLKWGE